MIQLENTAEEKIKVNFPSEEMQSKYGKDFDESQALYHLLSKMLRLVAGIDRIIVPGEFKSEVDESEAINCSVKVSDGYLYPLKQSLIFI